MEHSSCLQKLQKQTKTSPSRLVTWRQAFFDQFVSDLEQRAVVQISKSQSLYQFRQLCRACQLWLQVRKENCFQFQIKCVRYRKWSMRDGQLDIIVRCEVDAVQESTSRPLLVATKALVEFCQKQGSVNIDWRQKLESQRGAVFATELKNNANKIAKWTAAALLANVDLIKLG